MRNNPHPYLREPLYPVTSAAPMNRLGLDLCGPFPLMQRGNRYILNIICLFTKYVVSLPVEDTRATTLARALLNHCVLVHGSPNTLTTDSATTFTADFFQEFCRLLYINKRYATPYHSAGNGSERTFRTFQNMLSKYITAQNPDFDEFLSAITFCYNTSVHEMTKESPFFLMYDRDPRFLIEDIIMTENLTSYSEIDTEQYKLQLINALKIAWSLAHEFNQQA
ncbi:unnamed protein product [Gongylonema pulchrum]|uniref:Integrase catalytic domain-containing protein n=1 Tax=Gongylonema pulchrum TaxID=637853 RepID=A0A183DY56_9BILA|nr:unnamed protein product [Gongylonema pulchrum]